MSDKFCPLTDEDPFNMAALLQRGDTVSKLLDPKTFFAMLKKGKLLGPILDEDEVRGTNAILEACGEAKWPMSWTAYALATSYHETAHTMLPIKEYGGPKYFKRMYDIEGNRPALAKANGNTSPGDGAKYYGRGYVQLTWKNNYIKAERKLGIKGLVADPDLALLPENAAKIMISGMSEGWFTGHSCADHLSKVGSASVTQFTEARRIINGTDKAELIAAYAIHFQDGLIVGKWA